MAHVPTGQILLSIYSWASMFMYLYLLINLVIWRRQRSSGKRQFKASYYLLFMLQAIADFYLFLSIELIQKPARFNYFNLELDQMHNWAVISYANLVIASSLINCGHILIALNRLTAFFRPHSYEMVSAFS
ncbi:hypothetical protein COOONC_19255 [Cooperia oncophora]